MLWYAIASLTPAAIIVMACLWGGLWSLIALLSVSALVFGMDRISHHIAPQEKTGQDLTIPLGAAHFIVLVAVIVALCHHGGLTLLDKALIFVAAGRYVGQVSNSVAHELIHTGQRRLRGLGAAMYVSVLHGHHVSAHLLVHHVHVATDNDPNSARYGESFWRFLRRAALAEFVAGLGAENARRARAGKRAGLHPYVIYVAGAGVAMAFSLLIGGWAGLALYVALALYAQFQLLLSDYVQHYGLRRAQRPDGRPEPTGPQHSWNSPKWFSGAMTLNAPLHSDHHLRPTSAFPKLRYDPQIMPTLPHALPVMAVIALFPPTWRRMMDPRVARWQQAASN